MEEIISKEKLKEIEAMEEKVTGDCLKNDLNFILKKEGKEALKKVEEAMREIGYPIEHKTIKLDELFPVAVPISLIIVIQKNFNYDDTQLEEMGKIESKISSSIIRLFMKFFISLDVAAKNAQRMWQEHYKFGKLSIPEYSRKEKYIILRVEDFKTHIFICRVLKGYFSGVVEMIVGAKVTSEETKCIYKGDEYHEFTFKW